MEMLLCIKQFPFLIKKSVGWIYLVNHIMSSESPLNLLASWSLLISHVYVLQNVFLFKEPCVSICW